MKQFVVIISIRGVKECKQNHKAFLFVNNIFSYFTFFLNNQIFQGRIQ